MCAGLHAFVGDGTVAATVQLIDREAHRVEHATHLTFAALVDGDLDERGLGALLLQSHLGRGGHAVVELDPLPQRPQGATADLAADASHIGLLHAVARMHEVVGEHAVVREDDQAGGVHVEPAHREQGPSVGHEVDDHALGVRVATGTGDASRLVDQDVAQLTDHDRFAAHRDRVRCG